MDRWTTNFLLQDIFYSTHVFIVSHPSLHLVLDILQQFGHLIHFGCGGSQFSLGLPTPGGRRENNS